MENDNLTARLTNLSRAKRALFELRLKEKSHALVMRSIPRRSTCDTAPVPLSFAQERLWFLNQLEPKSPAYNESRAVRLTGRLNLEALKKALNQIVARHEVLRSTIVTVDGAPRQVVAQNRDVELPVINLQALPEADRDSEAQRLVVETIRKPFDLSRDLMLRVLLVRLADKEHILLIVKHHIASDGWSSGILWQELTTLYRAFIAGQSDPLPELPIQYADYALWQREWFQGEVLENQLSYWKKQLDGISVLQMPTDRRRPAVQSYRGKGQTIEFTKQLIQKLTVLSRQHDVTPFMTLLAVFQTLLYRYTAQEDIAVGCPIAGRTRQELEGMIGFFVNTLVMRVNFAGNPTFRELLVQVREVALGAYRHQDLPFERLVEELQPERNLSRSPLFQVAFAYQNTPKHALQMSDVIATPVAKIVETTKVDLHLSVNSERESMEAALYYATDLYDDVTIARLLAHFRLLLEAIVANPDRQVSELPMLTGEERQFLVEWNDTNRDYPKDKCIQQLVEEQVDRTPEAIAVAFGDQELTYRELNRRANQLARYLRKLGIGPGVLVGISLEQSLEMVVGFLAILKSGGVYLPLDPTYPTERFRFMFEDSAASVLVTQARLQPSLPACAAEVICLDAEWPIIEKETEVNLPDAAAGKNPAYVIYTSGSTGKPKGVLVPHQGICNLVREQVRLFEVGPCDRVLQFASLSFDASIFEMVMALTTGATLCCKPNSVFSGVTLMRFLQQQNITIVTLPPSVLGMLRVEKISGLRIIAVAGETCPPELSARWAEGRRFFNLYGPTECTIWSTAAELRQGDQTIPVGRPIANTRAHILDHNLQLVPLGVRGELCIGGVGVALGYLNRPELTAENFIPDPFSSEAGARLYRTGDLARYLPEGNIEFLGRIDNQVKIRGLRIELGEIESVLGEHPGVREAVVLARDEYPGDKRLVGYVVPQNEQACTTGELRSFLKQNLPEYMIPSAFVLLDTLPLTPNGKVDRKALPAPDQNRPEPEESYVGPRTPVEESLAEIWAEVLKLDKIGIHDNFFALGGHSLLATHMISRLCDSFKVEVPLRALFESPTVAGLAERIEEVYRKEERLAVRPMLPGFREKELLLSYGQQRLWFLDQYQPNSSVYNIPSALRLRGSLNIGALEQSLQEIIRRHECLRTTFSMADGKPVQVITPAVNLSLEIVDLSDHPEAERDEEARRLVHEEARRPFDLNTGPLFRTTLIRLAEQDHVLLLTLHHIVSDGWSMGVLYRELSLLYQAVINAQPSPLADLPIQYADYAIWQREWLRGDVLESQLSYWKKQLESIPRVLNLPTDYPRPAVQSYRGGRRSITLSKELSRELKALSRKEGVTLFMTLLAAFQTLLYRYTGQEDIVVGSPIANRNRAEIEGLIGLFVNTLVLRTHFSGNPTFRELLGRVRETALGAYAHQDLPFEKLVEELKPERSLSHSPLFQVLFNMVGQGDFKVDLLGITSERFSFSEAQSKFDLTLYVTEQKDEISLNLVYRADLFSQPRMTCFLEQYRYLLDQLVVAPQDPVQAYSLVTPESRELLPDPSAVLVEPSQQLVTGIFLSWATQTPNQTAVRQGEKSWTYSELAECAGDIAKVLTTSGLKPGDVVAIHGRRSFGLIAGMIGTLLSGGIILPIDHSLPNQRKQLMVKEAKAKRLLCIGDKRSGDAWLERNFTPSILVVDPGSGSVLDADAGPKLDLASLPEVTPDDPAYIFFTSGTTGIPKGVLGCHKGLSHFLTWQRETFAIGPEDRIAQLTGLSFDACLRDIFLPLTSGATLCLPESRDHLASDEIIAWLEREQISVLHTVPSLAQSWLADVAGKVPLPNLRRVFFVGESLTDALVRRWRAVFQNAAEIINLYGPTETTLVKCFYKVPIDLRSGVQPVGRAMPQAQALVLAQNNRLCGINERGEIVLRTPFRSLGYINAPEENRMRLVKNPFRDDAHDLVYFTGDAGRYAPDGTLEILGRLDDQVKVRGVRIEPAEVTAILAQHPLVDSCIVVAKKNDDADSTLMAYLMASKQGQPTSTQLRSYLLEQLPVAMLPSAFIFLDSLPLTSNGKVDRKALAALDHNRADPEESFVAPRTALEKMLVAIWAEVLKSNRVGINDNFFALGGHSLLATQLISRLRRALEVELPLRVLFEKPTVAGLSDHIESVLRCGRKDSQISKDNLGETEEIVL